MNVLYEQVTSREAMEWPETIAFLKRLGIDDEQRHMLVALTLDFTACEPIKYTGQFIVSKPFIVPDICAISCSLFRLVSDLIN